ncbi:MAG: ATP-binding protein, partial [Candidatus Gracilibacteria bacterium]|nr:ATP-binding protein [Candidatus Gracilibacteria bacterium]
NTIFLFDEIDSHLHYRNINKLWENLSYIEGKVITTTHIPDSIINNDISHINVVKDGVIDNDNSANSLINRLGNISDTYLYEKKLASKITNIVLIDDCTDWFIFLKLAKIKKGEEYNSKIEDIQPIKCGSGFNGNPNEIFGEKKLNWINEFILKNNSFNTKNIFSICDKDECPIAKIDDNMKYKEYHSGSDKKNQQFGSGGKIYYLSWKRREIENYFLSHTLLTEYELLEEVNNLLPPVKSITLNNSLDYNEIQTFQAKEVVQKFAQKELNGNNVWKDYNELEEIINRIPATEISEDIAKMYDFIFSKIR